MQALYKKGDANFPRLETDAFFLNFKNTFAFDEITHETMLFVENAQLLNEESWEDFVRQFAEHTDSADFGWRGEFWGKMMRGACFVYSYTKNEKLLSALKKTVLDILKTQDENGRISSYDTAHEFTGWDIWCRKYVLLGMQYFLEINTDKAIYEAIVDSMCRQVDHIMTKIGKAEDGLVPITRASRHWYGLNSSSLLEPVVRLYNVTGNEKYLDFACYIADEGACFAENIFRLAEQKKLRLYQYPVTKAYEMTSCFEGLLELYRITKTPWYKTAILNFADLILEDDFTVIGSAGCTHELFDHSTVRQANTTNHRIMQETCVTVTLMKFFMQLNLFTGDAKYIDAFERSYYNAYLGAVNTEGQLSSHELPHGIKPAVMPFDSYSPLTAGERGKAIGGFRALQNGKFYGCCVCIGSAGVGSVMKTALLACENGLVLNLYINGEISTLSPKQNEIKLVTKTAYPKDGKVLVKVLNKACEQFVLKLRIPEWSKATAISVNGKALDTRAGYVDVLIKNEEEIIELSLDMTPELIKPIPYESQVLMNKVIWGSPSVVVPTYDEEDEDAKNHVAIRRGPLMLAQDERFGYDLSVPANIVETNGSVELKDASSDFKTLVTLDVKTENGYMRLCDYQSAGKLYSSGKRLAVWIKNK